MFDAVFDFTKPQTIVTANRRQARHLNVFYQKKIGKGLCLVNILSWDNWVRQIFYAFCDNKILVNQHQGMHIWQSLIANENKTLLPHQVSQLAKLSHEARKMLKEWLLPDIKKYINHQESERFVLYLDLFEDCLNAQGLVDYYNAILKLLDSKNCFSNVPHPVYFYGFGEWTPLRKKLLSHAKQCSKHEVSVVLEGDCLPHLARRCMTFPDFSVELQCALQWAKKHTLQGEQVAIVVPNLDHCKHGVQWVAKEMLADGEVHFNISVPESVSQQPFMMDIMAYLRWHIAPLPAHSVRQLMHSKYMCFVDPEAKKMLHQKISGDAQVNIKTFAKDAGQYARLGLQPSMMQTASMAMWVQWLLGALELLDWRLIDAHQNVIFDALINSLLDTDVLGLTYSFESFINCFEQHCEQLPKPDNPDDTGIQIIAFREAIGIFFDRIWVVQMTDKFFPQTVRLHPWVDPLLQIEGGVTQAREDLLLEAIKEQLNQIAHYARYEVIHTVGLKYFDASVAYPSVLFEPEVRVEDDANILMNVSAEKENFPLEQCQDWSIHTKAVKTQIAVSALDVFLRCPFEYFCRQQLALRLSEEPGIGISAAFQGQWIHKALELVLQDASCLQTRNSTQIQQWVKKAQPAGDVHALIQNTMIAQFCDLIEQVIEMLPDANQVRFLCEQNIEVKVGKITLKGRIDRIDIDHQSNAHVLDYKYKQGDYVDLKPNDFIASPIKTMQLPVYALGIEKAVSVSWCILQPKKVSVVGSLSAEINVAELRPIWQNALEDVVHKITAGVFTPDPSVQKCRRCDYRSICRVSQ